jgi:hypothetical protein
MSAAIITELMKRLFGLRIASKSSSIAPYSVMILHGVLVLQTVEV